MIRKGVTNTTKENDIDHVSYLNFAQGLSSSIE